MLSAAPFESSGASLYEDLRLLSCPEPASRSGFSLARNDRPFPSRRHGVFVPDRPLQCLVGPSSGPFGLRLLATPVCPDIGDLNAACPLP
jgi:hypothetical protein